MAEGGTLQTVLLQIADLLRPLSNLFEPGRAQQSFAEMGFALTPAQASGLAGSLQGLTASVEALLEDAAALADAVEADDTGTMISEAAATIGKLVTAIQSINAVQSAASGLAVPDAGKLAERLFNALLVRALDACRGVNEALELIGVLERTPVVVGPTEARVAAFHFGKLGDWISSPVDALQGEYGWNGGGFDAPKLLKRLGGLLQQFNVPAFYDDALPDNGLDFVFFTLREKTDVNPHGLVLQSRQTISPGTITVDADDLKVAFDVAVQLPFGAQIAIRPPAQFAADVSGGSFAGEFGISIAADRSQAAEKYLIIGDPGGSRLEVGKLEAGLKLRIGAGGEVAPSVRGTLSQGKLMVSFANADGFLGKIMGGVDLHSEFDLGFGYASNIGLFFEGSASLEIDLPLHVSLGLVEISALAISVGIQGETFPITFGADISASLGPLAAVVQDVGLRADFRLANGNDGNCGPLDISLGFKPPSGVGLSVDAGVVKGGGFLFVDADRGEYAGALELSLLDFLSVAAVAVINTKLPDGSKGFSLVAVIGVEFNPGLQLGFGFTLIGVGGIIGLNRTMNLDALAQGVRTGAVDSVLFPHDVVANAPRIISDMKAFFPPAQGIFLIGPMAKVGWGTPTLVSLSLGVIIEIPGNIAIVGTLKIALPDEDAALIIIQVAFIGAIEFDKKRGWFYATLYDSRVLFMTLEGGIGVLAAFGDDPNFVLSVGGFHPAYNPPPLPFSAIDRLAINILNTPVSRIRVMCYFAVTSNTVQFGAAAELYFGISIASIEGHLAFDALFQFSPFHFIIVISASLSVKLFGAGLFSVRFRGQLDGPSPWHIVGTGSISILFWDVDVDFETTWGESTNTTFPPIPVMPLIEAEYRKLENWTAQLLPSSKLLVTLRDIDAGADLVLHPLGTLKISQRAVPLALTLDKLGNQKPSDANFFSLETTTDGIAVKAKTSESFAIAQFKELADADKLKASDYEPEEAGFELSAAAQQLRSSYATRRVARYEEVIIDKVFFFTPLRRRIVELANGLFAHFLGKNAAAQSPLSAKFQTELKPFDEKITVAQTGYVVALAADNSPVGTVVAFQSRASAEEAMASAVAANPKLAGQCHVIRPQEMKLAA